MEKLLEPLVDGPGDRDVLRVLSDALLEQELSPAVRERLVKTLGERLVVQ